MLFVLLASCFKVVLSFTRSFIEDLTLRSAVELAMLRSFWIELLGDSGRDMDSTTVSSLQMLQRETSPGDGIEAATGAVARVVASPLQLMINSCI